MGIRKTITEYLFVDHEPIKADVIFVPGSPFHQPVERAAQLYLEEWSAILLPSGNRWLFHGGKGSTESEAMREIAMRAGVPDSAILCEDKARHTVDNARLSAQILNGRGIVVKSAIICCQAFHARRCLQDYRREFPDVHLIVCPANTRGICRESWYKTPLGICKIITELMKCTWIFYFLISKVGHARARGSYL